MKKKKECLYPRTIHLITKEKLKERKLREVSDAKVLLH